MIVSYSLILPVSYFIIIIPIIILMYYHQYQAIKLAEQRMYRVSAKPMPNPSIEHSRNNLRSVLSEAQELRRPSSTMKDGNTNTEKTKPKTNPKKTTVVKPPRNFGGGKLGSGP